MKKNVTLWQTTFCLMVAALVLGSCGKKSTRLWFQKDYLAVQMLKGDSWSIIDKDGKEVVKEEYPADASFSSVYDGVFWVKQGDTYQLYSIDSPKKPLVDEEFAHVTEFEAGRAAVTNPNEQIRLIDTKGKTVATLPKSIKRCFAFTQWGYARIINTDNKAGVIDIKGNVVLKPEYAAVDIYEDMLVIRKDGDDKKVQVLDMNGKKVGDFDFEMHPINEVSEGLFIAKSSDADDAHIAAFDKTGKKVFEVKKADATMSGHFVGSYLTFGNSDGKYGVADKDGEIVIRPKYESLVNMGDGRFYAKKNDKWGVVNHKDETLIDFEYNDWWFVMGDHYVMKDGSSYSIVGSDGKEIESFYTYSTGAGEVYVEFVDVEALTNAIMEVLTQLENTQTAKDVAKKYELNMDNYRYGSSISRNLNYEDKIDGQYTINFDGRIAEEKTHQEQVNDGWFTSTRTISDGWQWTNALPRGIGGTLSIRDSAIDGKSIYHSLCQKLGSDHKKISDGVYSKNVKIAGKTLECRISLDRADNNLSYTIVFNK